MAKVYAPALTPHQLNELSAMMLSIASRHKDAAPVLERMAEAYHLSAIASMKADHRV